MEQGRSSSEDMEKAISEIWKPVPGFEGLYEVSNMGRVKSIKRTTTRGGYMHLRIDVNNGYVYTCLHKGNKAYSRRVHRLVLMAFVPDHPKEADQVDHIDGDKTNNVLSNLEWVTGSENMKRAYSRTPEKHSSRKVIDIDTKEIFWSATAALQSVHGRGVQSITRVCNGKRSNYRNHRFAFLEDYQAGIIKCSKVSKPKRSAEMLWR